VFAYIIWYICHLKRMCFCHFQMSVSIFLIHFIFLSLFHYQVCNHRSIPQISVSMLLQYSLNFHLMLILFFTFLFMHCTWWSKKLEILTDLPNYKKKWFLVCHLSCLYVYMCTLLAPEYFNRFYLYSLFSNLFILGQCPLNLNIPSRV
jgi:hypothetical protein